MSRRHGQWGTVTLLLAACAACGASVGGGARGAGVASPRSATHATPDGRPPLGVVGREGDARGAIAVAVTMEGLAPERGAVPAVALSALVEARLVARGMEPSAVGGWGGWRLHALVGSSMEGARVVEALTEAMLAPVLPDEPALAAVARKVGALARRPLPDRALIDVAHCTGEAYGAGSDAVPDVAEIEAWRRAALGLGRVAFASAGDEALADAAADALARGRAWPAAMTAATPADASSGDAPTVVYDASGEVPPAAARVVVTAHTATPEQAVGAAPALGDMRGPLASRLAALDAPAHVRSVVATAHRDGGCVAVTLDLAARDLAADAPARIATAAALARQEVAVELMDTTAPADLGRQLAARAADPREAAERAAWWLLSARRASGGEDLRTALTVGVAASRDARAPGMTAVGDLLRSEIDRATLAWHASAVESRTRVERAQGETWILLASTCGTMAESTSDAGDGAAVATAAAAQATLAAGDAHVEPVVTADGLGVLAHGPAHAGETPSAHARRLADLAARAFAADPLDPESLLQARTALLVRAGVPESRSLGALGAALAPGHPSWVQPFGTSFGLASASDEAIALRSSALRAGPLRVAVLANVDAAQADSAARAVDRWIARRPGETRVCPALPAPAAPRPGTYAIDVAAGASSEALLALPFSPADLAPATGLAAALDGPDGLLAHSLGASGDGSEPPLARSFGATVVGPTRSPALVIRLTAGEPSLDAAVAQTRGLLDRLRQGALREADRARAAALMANTALLLGLDPRARALDLWRGDPPATPPSLDALRAFAASTLHDDALVIVAARPPRLDASGRPRIRDTGAAR